MFSESNFGLGNQASSIRVLFEYGRRQATLLGEDKVYDFSIGNPSVPPPQAITDTFSELLRAASPSALHAYSSAVGHEDCRKAIAEELNARYGLTLNASMFFMTCGAAAALCAAIGALTLSHESEFVAMAPYFPEYRCFVEARGAKFRTVPASDDFRLNLPALREVIGPKTQGVILNSPNNPSGKMFTAEELAELGALLSELSQQYGHPIYLISDEPYRELVYGDQEAPWVPNYYKNTIICYSYSKLFSLPGERIGYVLVPPEAEDAVPLYKAVAGAARSMGYVCAPVLAQRVIAACAAVKTDLTTYAENRKLLYEGLKALGYQSVYPDGAFYLFVKAPEGSGEAFSERAKARNVLIVPGTSFGCPEYVRISYCVPTARIQAAMPEFAAMMTEFKA